MLLLIIHLLLGTDCRVEEPDYANADRFYVALAKSQEFFTYDRCGKAQPQVDVYAVPAKAEKIGEIRWARAGADSARRRHRLDPAVEARRGRAL